MTLAEAVCNSLPVVQMHSISKSFGQTHALTNVDLELHAGEVHALIGENGAGKSTLIKIMTGLYTADTGSLLIDGEPTTVSSSADAQQLGVAAIYQEPLIFPDLSVAENIFMGHSDRGPLVSWKNLYREATEVLSQLDINLDSRAPAGLLTVGEQQAVEIAKALSQDVRVLIMDEPTAALSAHEVDRLFRQVKRLTQSGVAVLFISHRLDEVFTIADRISVFRDGRHISTRPTSETTEEIVVREMVGRELRSFFTRTKHQSGDTALRTEDLSRDGVFSNISFSVSKGEVLGFAGLVGAGRTDVALALFGIAPATSGTIFIEDNPVSITSARLALDHGIAYLTEDRRKLGLSLPQGIPANISLPTLDRYTNRAGLIDTSSERDLAFDFRDRLNIRTSNIDSPVGILSGGNQQKTMLAKWLNTKPTILILDEPTRGIDVGAKAEVHRLIDQLAKDGIAVIMISSDLPEVLAMSDRIIVMRSGTIAATFEAAQSTQEEVMNAAVGTFT